MNVVIQPVVLTDKTIRVLTGLRSVPADDGFGKYGLPAGWQDKGEDSRTGAARELFEEHGIETDPSLLLLFDTYPGDKRDKLVRCWLAPDLVFRELPDFQPNEEVSARALVSEGIELAFDIHTRWVQAYFSGKRGIDPKTCA